MSPFIFVLFVLVILCGMGTIISVTRMWVGRGKGRLPSDRTLAQIEERLARMEQSIDAVSIEVERISEGQRFTTKLLSDRTAGPAQ
ncbi:MAG TPA: hypothetical protein VFW98_13555 [Gemmatimonadaceae bacterium]|nr:hypothetical protein [Gemmatimonadaceae bacterium]